MGRHAHKGAGLQLRAFRRPCGGAARCGKRCVRVPHPAEARTSSSLPRRSSACFLRFCRQSGQRMHNRLAGGAGHRRRHRRPPPPCAAHLSIQVAELLPRDQRDGPLAPASSCSRLLLLGGAVGLLSCVGLFRHGAAPTRCTSYLWFFWWKRQRLQRAHAAGLRAPVASGRRSLSPPLQADVGRPTSKVR